MESINRPPLKLLFGSPEFILEGIVQATVRVGAKWRDDLAGKGQVVIPCFDAETTERVGQATVVGTLFGSFKDFGYIGSVVNHQEDCRDFDGLIDVLSECYPGFDPDADQVTVIFFKYAGDVPAYVVENDDYDDDEAAAKFEEDKPYVAAPVVTLPVGKAPVAEENTDDSGDTTTDEIGNVGDDSPLGSGDSTENDGDSTEKNKIVIDFGAEVVVTPEPFAAEVYDVKGLTSGLDAKEVTDDEVVTEDSKAS